jgi:hypothetical protein
VKTNKTMNEPRTVKVLRALQHNPGRPKATKFMLSMESAGLIEWSALGYVVSERGRKFLQKHIAAEQLLFALIEEGKHVNRN